MIADEAEIDLPKLTGHAFTAWCRRPCTTASNTPVHPQVRVVMAPDGGPLGSDQDNGIGFDPKSEKGLGLLGIAERVGALGGRFHIESQPGEGAVLSRTSHLPAGQSLWSRRGA